MGETSAIQWTDATWNGWIGCTKVSPACKNCYAERIETRFGRNFSIVRKSTTFKAPLKWKEPRMIFTCSMSDFFHKDADKWRDEAWDIIRQTPQHTYQILTKRPERIRDCLPEDWGDGWPNVWLGVSVEMQQYMSRLDELAKIPARLRFVSAEPLLGNLDFYEYHPDRLHVVDWIIVGGESDPHNPRPMKEWWVRRILAQCLESIVPIPFFFKQWGGRTKCKCHNTWGCRLLDGRTWDEMPVSGGLL